MSPTATTTKHVAPKNGAASALATVNSDKRKALLMEVAAGKMSLDDADEKLKALQEPRKAGNLYAKVSEKGGCSVYGLQRMPVTLYVEQWERLLGFSDELKKFLVEHDAQLKRKVRE
jgi:hypothetical protein